MGRRDDNDEGLAYGESFEGAKRKTVKQALRDVDEKIGGLLRRGESKDRKFAANDARNYRPREQSPNGHGTRNRRYSMDHDRQRSPSPYYRSNAGYPDERDRPALRDGENPHDVPERLRKPSQPPPPFIDDRGRPPSRSPPRFVKFPDRPISRSPDRIRFYGSNSDLGRQQGMPPSHVDFVQRADSRPPPPSRFQNPDLARREDARSPGPYADGIEFSDDRDYIREREEERESSRRDEVPYLAAPRPANYHSKFKAPSVVFYDNKPTTSELDLLNQKPAIIDQRTSFQSRRRRNSSPGRRFDYEPDFYGYSSDEGRGRYSSRDRMGSFDHYAEDDGGPSAEGRKRRASKYDYADRHSSPDSASRVGRTSGRSEVLKRGRTKMPFKYTEEQAIQDKGYPYHVKGHSFIIEYALEQSQITELLTLSQQYRERGDEKNNARETKSRYRTKDGHVVERRDRESFHEEILFSPSHAAPPGAYDVSNSVLPLVNTVVPPVENMPPYTAIAPPLAPVYGSSIGHTYPGSVQPGIDPSIEALGMYMTDHTAMTMVAGSIVSSDSSRSRSRTRVHRRSKSKRGTSRHRSRHKSRTRHSGARSKSRHRSHSVGDTMVWAERDSHGRLVVHEDTVQEVKEKHGGTRIELDSKGRLRVSRPKP
ncbi:hypothetical protein CFO_g4647 [Ceratocystis platani]|uniref:DUF8035 domain-containing protein n=1 Tax=Ceratocystis fimbriata f. sp. platani TaxID=88771 RepID=A0A0F8B0M5_CERFI|nr:hypothetical protein CFO_g4647 [Ceratocystis platani]